ncbi:unnamed protein product [Heligmosomoides polygyrus]|uniref:HNF-p1 domain-containing protein n=1 Tax=Heligmosomoides polygyrus TaxID=6339 RepID=A0A183FLT1_HELPZ|nr:unnamed protein product [Heligmosomoides polygyrus]
MILFTVEQLELIRRLRSTGISPAQVAEVPCWGLGTLAMEPNLPPLGNTIDEESDGILAWAWSIGLRKHVSTSLTQALGRFRAPAGFTGALQLASEDDHDLGPQVEYCRPVVTEFWTEVGGWTGREAIGLSKAPPRLSWNCLVGLGRLSRLRIPS